MIFLFCGNFATFFRAAVAASRVVGGEVEDMHVGSPSGEEVHITVPLGLPAKPRGQGRNRPVAATVSSRCPHCRAGPCSIKLIMPGSLVGNEACYVRTAGLAPVNIDAVIAGRANFFCHVR